MSSINNAPIFIIDEETGKVSNVAASSKPFSTNNQKTNIIAVSTIFLLAMGSTVGWVSSSSKAKQLRRLEELTTDISLLLPLQTSSTPSHLRKLQDISAEQQIELLSFEDASTPDTPPAQNPYFFGDEFVTVPELGRKVPYANGESSEIDYHIDSDAAGIIELEDGGYVYMANSEAKADDGGGVYGLYFNSEGEVTEYKALLTGTNDNCGGGLTPWGTWVSCEEETDIGQCWQVDPYGRAQETKLGGDGGNFESVAVDASVHDTPIFYTTEDTKDGALRRFIANQYGWDALHTDGEESYLHLLDDGTYEWTTDMDIGRKSAEEYFRNSEGIQVHEGNVYFMSKKYQNMTWTSEESGVKFYGEGSFDGQPDQHLFGPSRKYIYFTEDGSEDPGVYARFGDDETYFTMFQAIAGGIHTDDETIGIALSPDGKRFYAGYQEGYIFELTREDGLRFE